MKQYRVTIIRGGCGTVPVGIINVVAENSRLAGFIAIDRVRKDQALASNITLFASSLLLPVEANATSNLNERTSA